jgi:hypothetical protein
LANALPELVCDAWTAGQKTSSSVAAERLSDLRSRIQAMSFPRDVAAVMEARGLQVGSPKNLGSESTARRYEALVKELRPLMREWNLT